MRIGILTYHRSINYGAVMQSYALLKRISEIENVEVEIIDYMSSKMDRYYKLFTIYRGKNGLIRIDKRVEMYRSFQKTISQLSLSSPTLITDNDDSFYKYIDGRYDIIVVGSDAVWNYEKRGFPNPYFLTRDINAKKFSYAASCNGIKYDTLDKKKLELIGKSLKSFEYVGVRDILTEQMVKQSNNQIVCYHNCDPTFLLDFDKDGLGDEFVVKLKEKLIKKYKWDVSKKHIGLMLSNLNGNLAKILVEKLKEKYGDTIQIVSIYSYCRYADIPYISDLTPFEWSRIFSLFDLTFSKYFHGTLLSIKNGTPVISLSAEKTYEGIPSKVEDVLQRLELLEFYCPAKDESDIIWGELMRKIDNYLVAAPKDKMMLAIAKEKLFGNSFFEKISTEVKKGDV